MSKKFLNIVVSSCLLVASLVLVDRALADDNIASGKIAFRPIGQTEVEGHTNSTNTGFSIRANLTDVEFDHANININGLTVAAINQKGWLEYGIEGITNSQLRTYFPAGNNIVDLQVCTPSPACSVMDSTIVISDYNSAILGWDFATTTDKKNLAIGDVCDFEISTNEDIELLSASYNGHALYLENTTNPGIYKLSYAVSGGDASQALPLQFSDWLFIDKAGNVTSLDSLGTIDFTIDTKYPTVNLVSPENGKIYNKSELPFLFESDEAVSMVSLEVDGLPTNVANGGVMSDLGEGEHYAKLIVSDLAGNRTTVNSNFRIDTMAPFVSYNSIGSSFSLDEVVTIHGSGELGSRVILEIGPHRYETVVDINGGWLIAVNCDEIGAGNFLVKLSLTDLSGNITTEELGEIVIKVNDETAISSVIQQTSLAMGNSSSVETDVKAKIVYSQNDGSSSEQTFAPTEKNVDVNEIAKTGSLAAGDIGDKSDGFNWSIILVTLSVIALVSAAIAAGYYGYEFIVLSNIASSRSRVKPKPNYAPDKITDTDEIRTKSDNEEKDSKTGDGSSNKTRW